MPYRNEQNYEKGEQPKAATTNMNERMYKENHNVILGDYRHFSYPAVLGEVMEDDLLEEVKDYLSEIVAKDARHEKKGYVSAGDSVLFSYTILIYQDEQEAYTAIDSKQDAIVAIGDEAFPAEMREKMVGRPVGDLIAAEISFPPEFLMDELTGKKTLYLFRVHEHWPTPVCEISDEWVRDNTIHDSLESLREEIRETMTQTNREAIKKALLVQLMASSMVIVSPELMQSMVMANMQRDKELATEEGESLKEYVKEHYDTDMEGYEETLRREIYATMSTECIYQELVERENVDLTDVAFEEYLLEQSYLEEDEDLADFLEDVGEDTAADLREAFEKNQIGEMLLEFATAMY